MENERGLDIDRFLHYKHRLRQLKNQTETLADHWMEKYDEL